MAIDAFTGAGGNAIALGRTCRHVLAIDCSEQRLRLAKANAGVYGATGVVDFICGDFFRRVTPPASLPIALIPSFLFCKTCTLVLEWIGFDRDGCSLETRFLVSIWRSNFWHPVHAQHRWDVPWLVGDCCRDRSHEVAEAQDLVCLYCTDLRRT